MLSFPRVLVAAAVIAAAPAWSQQAGGQGQVMTLESPEPSAQAADAAQGEQPDDQAPPEPVYQGPPALNPVANPVPLVQSAPPVPSDARFNPSEWPDDAGRDGLVVPARWLWERAGHRWDARERAIRLSDPTLWRAAGQTPQGWVPSGESGVIGWLPKGEGACVASQRIAYALRLHRIPVTLEEYDTWNDHKDKTCPQRWSDTQKAQQQQAEASRAADLFVPSDTPVLTPDVAREIGVAPTQALDGTQAPHYPTQTGVRPTLRDQALDYARNPNSPHNAHAIAKVLDSVLDSVDVDSVDEPN